jgi:hypothetical protein
VRRNGNAITIIDADKKPYAQAFFR